jgi:gluconokinase
MDGPTTITVVVMGVSGTGKTTAGTALAERDGWAFAEGDKFHPPANVQKMSEGIPLTDEDRWPWLQAIADWIHEQETAGRNAVVACSALRRAYRDLLREGNPSVWFAHLTATEKVLTDRMQRRAGHYMPPSLLPSQLATLEELEHDEPGIVITDEGPPGAVVDAIDAHVRLELARRGAAAGAPAPAAAKEVLP